MNCCIGKKSLENKTEVHLKFRKGRKPGLYLAAAQGGIQS